MANIKWQYADHWSTVSAKGPITQFANRREMDRFVKQISAIGFRGVGMFVWNLAAVSGMFGSVRNYKAFLAERGLEKIVDLFWASPQVQPGLVIHDRANHDALFGMLEHFTRSAEGLEVENLVVMPTHAYNNMEPVDDEKIKVVADLWNRVGRMAAKYGMKLGCHHEFWCGIRTREQIDLFYDYADPAYVYLFLDTAQHTIADVDPVELYRRYHARVCGFHFKDARHVDRVEDYRSHPDAELVAKTTPRWFYEMGTPGGLVDFPALMRALKEHRYSGWIGVEHDKADVGGGNYPETTAQAMWYARNVLEPIYS